MERIKYCTISIITKTVSEISNYPSFRTEFKVKEPFDRNTTEKTKWQFSSQIIQITSIIQMINLKQ